jgi:serine protease inhibitor
MKNLTTTNLATMTNDTPQKDTPRFDVSRFPQSDNIINALNEMFPEQTREDKTLQRAKEILGKDYSTEDVKSLIASFEYLIENWLEQYERKVFNNKTVKEILHSF